MKNRVKVFVISVVGICLSLPPSVAMAAQAAYLGAISDGLSAPTSLAVDSDYFAVLEPFTRQIAVFSADGQVSRRVDIDSRARGLVRLSDEIFLTCDQTRASVRAVSVATGESVEFLAGIGNPVDLVLLQERLLVLSADGRVHLANLEGVLLRSVVLSLPTGEPISAATSLAWDPERERYYVLDQVHSRIIGFDADGRYACNFGAFGSGAGDISRGGGIDCDADGYIYVCDRYQGRVAVFEPSGGFVCNIDPLALGAERLELPTGIAVDPEGAIYVASTENAQIQIFSLDKLSGDGEWLQAAPAYPADQADISCNEFKLMAVINIPAGQDAAPSGIDFRLLRGVDPGQELAEIENLALDPVAPGEAAATRTATWRPETDCVEDALFAWQARARSEEDAGPWSPLRWFRTESPSAKFLLGQNYPNPFNPWTVIPFRAPLGSDPELSIFDVRGRLVRQMRLLSQSEDSGEVIWEGRDEQGDPVTSGLYFYRLRAGSFQSTRKMILVR